MHYIKVPNNAIADTFSRLKQIDDSLPLEGKNAPLEMPSFLEQECNIVQNAKILECFLKLPILNEPGKNPLNYGYLL